MGAKTLTLDQTTGLHIPPRALFQETESGGTRVHFELPSSFYVENSSPELTTVLEGAGAKFEAFLRKVLS